MKCKMKTVAVGFLVMFLVPAAGRSADEHALRAIKALYGETAAAIALAQKGEGGGLYSNELVINSRGGSWRAVGLYSQKAVFWYSDQPEFVAAEGRKERAALAKVEVRETAAAVSTYTEFLYMDGEPVFVFRKESGGGEPGEERVYLKGDRVLLRSIGAKETQAAFDPSSLLRAAAHWQKLFLLSFGEAAPAPEHPIDAWLAACMKKDPSTQGANACLGQAFDKWDAEMNRAYRELAGRLAEGERGALREAQRAWVAFRDSELAWLGKFYGGLDGTMYGSMRAADRVELVRRRAMELSSLLDVLAQE